MDPVTTSLEVGDEAAAAGLAAFMGVYSFVVFIVAVLAIVAMWKIFTKAGKPGWASIIPIYNTIVLLEIAGRPVWWVLLLFIPLVNIVVLVLVMLDLAKSFGKGTGFAIGLILFSTIFFLILGFDSSTYKGQGALMA